MRQQRAKPLGLGLPGGATQGGDGVVAPDPMVGRLGVRRGHLADQALLEQPADDAVERADLERGLVGERFGGGLDDAVAVQLAAGQQAQELEVERRQGEELLRVAGLTRQGSPRYLFATYILFLLDAARGDFVASEARCGMG